MLRWLWLPSLLVADVPASDERRHAPGAASRWAESWYFDFSDGDAALGGYVRLTLYPNLGVAWYWAALVGQGRRLVMVKDHDLEPPRGRDLEIRGQGIWSAVNCETPLDHWSVGLEAFAVAYDDPTEAFRSERGDLVGLGFDLEWEATVPAAAAGDGYGQPCRVTGEILVGDERLDFDASGYRSHTWGDHEASSPAASGVFADGTWFASRSLVASPDGYSATVMVGEMAVEAMVASVAPILLEAPDGSRTRLTRALCRYRSADGRHGAGWAEWPG